jgi:hypothetical protein
LRKPLTPTAALAQLLPWVNGAAAPKQARPAIAAFLRAFDGGADSSHLRVMYDAGQDELAGADLDAIRKHVVALLRSGFPPEPGMPAVWGSRLAAMPSLTFGVKRAAPESRGIKGRVRDTWSKQPGAFTVLLDGELLDLLRYLLLHVLAMPGTVNLTRCPAPAPGNWQKRCGKFVLSTGIGRPREYCPGAACRVREHAKRTQEAGRVAAKTKRVR